MSTAYGIYTVKELFGRMLSKLDVKTPDSQLYPKFLKELNIQQSKIYNDVVKDLKKQSYYITPSPITFTNNAYQFTLISDFESFYNLAEATYKTVPFVENNSEFDNLQFSTYWKDEIACTKKGEYLYLYRGADVEVATLTFTLYYVRKVKTLASDTDKVDIPDELIAGLVDSLTAAFLSKKP